MASSAPDKFDWVFPMRHGDEDGTYSLTCGPKMYWETHRFVLSDVKVLTYTGGPQGHKAFRRAVVEVLNAELS